MSYAVLLKLAQRGRFTATLRALVIRGINAGLYTQAQLEALDEAQANS